jgi:predicted lipoprotein
MNWKIIATLSIIGSLSIASCDKEEEPDATADFDKKTLLANLSDNIILPSINQFKTDLIGLSSKVSQLDENTSQQDLEEIRLAWKSAYLTWQTVKIFDFGPIRMNAFKSATGTYPVDTSDINNNIASGSYELGTAGNTDAIGLPALDFLLYKNGALEQIQSNGDYRTYIRDVVNKMNNETDIVLSGWDSYTNEFKESTGTSSTSGFSIFINEFNRDYELAKNAKVGIPLGKQSLGIQQPEFIEARYSGISFELLEESIVALQKVYNGDSFENNESGVGCDDYLIHLDRSALDNKIDDTFSDIKNKVAAFNESFESAIFNNADDCDELYLMLQQHTVNIKTDMTSAFGVLITYQDNDGD